MPHFSHQRTRLWYDTGGNQGHPVLLIMGLGVEGVGWLPQVLHIQAHRRVAWYDNRGIGKSDGSRAFYSMRRLAADARALLDHLGWQRAHIVGMSMGGMIAQQFALEFRERTLSLTLIATHAGGPSTSPPRLRSVWLFLRAQFGGRRKRWGHVRELIYPRPIAQDPGNAALMELSSTMLAIQALPRTFAQQLGAVLTHRTRHRLSELAGLPTLIVRPGADILIPGKESDRLQKAIPGSRLVRFDDAGHGITAQCYDLLNPILVEHFTQADPV